MCAFAQRQQDIKQAVAVLAAGQAHHHLVAVLDHVEVADGLADQPAQPLVQLVVFVGDLFGLFQAGRVVHHFVHYRFRPHALMWMTSTPTPSQSG
jgi:hypothetical protein